MAKLTEQDMTIPVLRILDQSPTGSMPMSEIKDALETVLQLSEEDLAPSTSRPPEPTWRQIAGNITSHRGAEGNIVTEGLVEYISRDEGLRLTDAGRKYLERRGG